MLRAVKSTLCVQLLEAPTDIKMLRNFGQAIETLHISFISNKNNGDRSYEKELENAICDNCSETVKTIRFFGCASGNMKGLENPFENARSIRFINSHIGSLLGQLEKWFPKMQDLQFDSTYVFDANCIHFHFPELRSLKVHNAISRLVRIGRNIFTNSDLKIVSLLNPQLRHLDIKQDLVQKWMYNTDAIVIDWDLLTFISKNLKLETLTLNLENRLIIRPLPWRSAVPMEYATNQLTLKFRYLYIPFDHEALAAFVICAEPKRLEIIAYESFRNFFTVDKLQFFQELPHLLELFVECAYNAQTLDAVIILLTNCGYLEKIALVFNFNSKKNVGPCPIYLETTFCDKFRQNNALAQKWTLQFKHMKNRTFEQFYFDFQKRKSSVWRYELKNFCIEILYGFCSEAIDLLNVVLLEWGPATPKCFYKFS
ncbi:hypothetical protein Bhyg_04445 [Pseudolycoriella hygida]|uniref:Uncharacterized protein n=1 Tax=Pseudolycoriella hygida TaxID=35572 RepID=A0A9Q0NFA4_9DIPT|nr:hypothetical protein Bhyg_04445 [Pseudolycoriella hygida]